MQDETLCNTYYLENSVDDVGLQPLFDPSFDVPLDLNSDSTLGQTSCEIAPAGWSGWAGADCCWPAWSETSPHMSDAAPPATTPAVCLYQP